MKNFIQVKYDFLNLNENNSSELNVIRTEGFLLYHYFLYEQGNKLTCTLTIKAIQEMLNKDYNNRPLIKYSENKQNPISLLKDRNTIIKYIKILNNNKYIKIHNEIPKSVNTPIIIECIKRDCKGFDAFPSSLFIDKIHRIGHIGFTLLCLLGKNFNSNYGSISCEGFANPSEEYMSKIINRDIKTVRGYLYLLQEEKLIKIKKQTPLFKGYNEHNVEVYEFINNHYIVDYKLTDNKYNIENE